MSINSEYSKSLILRGELSIFSLHFGWLYLPGPLDVPPPGPHASTDVARRFAAAERITEAVGGWEIPERNGGFNGNIIRTYRNKNHL